jgi:hypothetical protein
MSETRKQYRIIVALEAVMLVAIITLLAVLVHLS